MLKELRCDIVCKVCEMKVNRYDNNSEYYNYVLGVRMKIICILFYFLCLMKWIYLVEMG